MAIFKRTVKLASDITTGFGTNSDNSGGRFYNPKTRSANVVKRGVGLLERYSWYHTMLAMPGGRFILLLFSIYVLINIFFAGIYYLIGIDHLAGIQQGSPLKNFSEVFFFSAQTFTTVGYGRISPVGFLASAVSTFEAFLGLLSFALATGLFYGRFSRPQAFLRFSDNAIIAPYKNGIALMFRLSPFKNNLLSEAEAKVNLAMQVEEDGKRTNKFYNLDLEISKIDSLSLSWTLVHAINDKSPLYNFTHEDMVNANTELLIFVRAFDEVFSNTVIERYSYIAPEIVWGARYKIMYHPDAERKKTVLEVNELNSFERVTLPAEATAGLVNDPARS